MLRFFLTCYFLLLISLPISAKDAAAFERFENKLDEAHDYLTVNPAQSIAILQSLKELDRVPPMLFIRWHIINARAAVPTNQPDRLYESVEAVFTYQQTPYFKQRLTSIMSALGIWLRQKEYFDDAQISLECAYKYAANERQRLTLSNSMALVARSQDNTAKARALFIKNSELSKSLELPNVTAMIESNLGYLALDENKIEEAESYFRNALNGYQRIDRRAGQISAGLNLLMVFLIQDHVINFERLYGPTSTLTNAFPNDAKQALLLWLELDYKQRTDKPINSAQQLLLKDAFNRLESDKMKILVHRYFAKSLNMVVVPPKKEVKTFTQPWFELVKNCQW